MFFVCMYVFLVSGYKSSVLIVEIVVALIFNAQWCQQNMDWVWIVILFWVWSLKYTLNEKDVPTDTDAFWVKNSRWSQFVCCSVCELPHRATACLVLRSLPVCDWSKYFIVPFLLFFILLLNSFLVIHILVTFIYSPSFLFFMIWLVSVSNSKSL